MSLKFIRLVKNNIKGFVTSCLKCICDLTALYLDSILTGIRSAPSPFLFSTALFLVFY